MIFAFTGQTRVAFGPGGFGLVWAQAAAWAVTTETYILLTDPGSYILSGVADEMLRGLALQATPGSYGLTGPVASLVASLSLVASPGTYVLTGVDGTLLRIDAPTANLKAG